MIRCSAVGWMRTKGSKSARSPARVGIVTMVSIVATSVSRQVSAWAADQVSALSHQIASRSSSGFGVSRSPVTSTVVTGLRHARLQGGTVEGLRFTACETGGDLFLEGGNRGLAFLVLADQVTDIIARVAEAAVMGSALDPVLHRVGQRYIHRGHRVVLRVSDGIPKVRTSLAEDPSLERSGFQRAGQVCFRVFARVSLGPCASNAR